ncbi:MAG: hypothetical protein R2911_21695 [Caldilineaceae bacterium]
MATIWWVEAPLGNAGNRLSTTRSSVLILGNSTMSNTTFGKLHQWQFGSGVRIRDGAQQNLIGPANVITSNGGLQCVWISGADACQSDLCNHISRSRYRLAKTWVIAALVVYISDGAQSNS